MVGKDDEKINQMNDKEMVQKWMKSKYQAAVLFAYFIIKIIVIHYHFGKR